jgi:poly(A) polymerase
MAELMGGVFVPLDEVNRIGRVVVSDADTGKNWNFDFSSLRGDIAKDLSTRDFTINAMAIDLMGVGAKQRCFYGLLKDLIDLPVIDPFSGQNDLQEGSIRAVLPTIFVDDPARLLRAVRFAAELDFTIEKDTQTLMERDAFLASSVAGERIHEELMRLFLLPGSGKFAGFLDKLGILKVLIPELEPARDTAQPKEHQWNVLEHSLNMAWAIDFLLHNGDWLFDSEAILRCVPWSSQLDNHFNDEVSHGSTRSSLLKIAAILHDIAKPETKAVTDNGKIRFLGHDRLGAEKAVPILERLRFSNKEIRLVEKYITYHLRPTQLTHEALPSKHALYRYFRDTGDSAIDILFLSLADHLAARGNSLDSKLWREHTELVEYIISQYYNTEELVKPHKLIDGNDLINLFNLKPGPEVGRLLEAMREAQASGEINNREQALVYMYKILKDRTGK